MVNDAEAATGPVTAGPNDPRITSLGAVLRKMHLDELPQLLNVLRGEMSLVGPRPERLKFVEQFLREMPAYRLRLHVRPGITGLAQIKGTYSTEPGKKLRFDLLYICRYSVAFDVGILIETFLGLLGLLFWSAPAAVEAKDEPLRNFQVSDSRT
jgi:lipopolysaccharide/colanic/teichoic acid biosynthesis glycosyltransferase